jgi:hypothetical protein
MVAARLRGFLFFGTANAISTRLHAAAKGLEAAGGTSSSGSSSELGGGASLPSGNGAVSPILATSPWRLRGPQRPADRVYGDSSKHNGALFASVAAPKFMVVDFSQVKGLDATAARTLGALFRWVGRWARVNEGRREAERTLFPALVVGLSLCAA